MKLWPFWKLARTTEMSFYGAWSWWQFFMATKTRQKKPGKFEGILTKWPLEMWQWDGSWKINMEPNNHHAIDPKINRLCQCGWRVLFALEANLILILWFYVKNHLTWNHFKQRFNFLRMWKNLEVSNPKELELAVMKPVSPFQLAFLTVSPKNPEAKRGERSGEPNFFKLGQWAQWSFRHLWID